MQRLMPCGLHWLPCWWSAVVLESFPAQSGNVPRAPSLDAARQFTLSQVVLWSVVRCMAGQGVLFLSLKMRQNSIESLPRFIGYDILFLDTGDDPDSAAAAATDLDVYTEDSF